MADLGAWVADLRLVPWRNGAFESDDLTQRRSTGLVLHGIQEVRGSNSPWLHQTNSITYGGRTAFK